MDIAILILSIISLAVTGVQGISEAVASNSKISKYVAQLAKDISKNSDLVNQLTEAYNTKNTQLANALFQSSGYGTRVDSIKREMAKLEKDFKKKREILNNEGRDLQSRYSQMSDMNMRNDVVSNFKKPGIKDPGTYESKASPISSDGPEQTVNGGLAVPVTK